MNSSPAFFNKEYTRVFTLIFLVAYIYFPFITTISLGSHDSDWYQYILHDAIIQSRQGIFPVYVGQSIFCSIGTIVRAPYYLMLGQLLDFLTFRQFNPIIIQHLTILFSAFGGAFITYFLMKKLIKTQKENSSWYALALSFLYIASPGVRGLITSSLDMYNSFMVLPYLPIVMYGLIRTHQKNDIFSYIITSAALSIIYMAHPPIALWTTFVCICFYGIRLFYYKTFSIKTIFLPLIVPCLLSLFCLWYFIAIYTLDAGTEFQGTSSNYVSLVVSTLRSDLPGVFLPIQIGMAYGSTTPYLQLGYALWFIFIYGVFIVFRRKNENSFLVFTFVGCTTLIILLLYPLPIIGTFLWNLLPKMLQNITFFWPMQRFYIILAALLSFTGLLCFEKKRTLSFLLGFFCCWNLYEDYYFLNRDLTAPISTHKLLLSPHSIYSHYQQFPDIFPYFFPEGMFDPHLRSKLLNQHQASLEEFNDEKILMEQCFSDKSNTLDIKPLIANLSQFTFTEKEIRQSFLELTIHKKQKYLLCLQHYLSPKTQFGLLGLRDSQWRAEKTNPYQHFTPQNINTLSPIYTEKNRQLFTFFDKIIPENGQIQIKKWGLMKYNSSTYTKLPIRIISFTPFTAIVNTNQPDTYLTIFKLYVLGYQATVNNIPVPVLETANHQIMVPLKKAGLNKIVLTYTGTKLMKITLYISSFAWLLFIIFIGYLFLKKCLNSYLLIKLRFIFLRR